MQNRNTLRSSFLLTCLVALGMASGTALAQGHGGGGHSGGGGGGHFSGGGGAHFGGGHAYAGHGGYAGYRGGYGGYRGYGYGGYRGGYGWHGDYGWRGGYYGGWGGWGWGGVGLGLYFATLPLYYSTFWWDGSPYYYADHVYYRYDTGVGQYETVAPPPGAEGQAAAGEPVGTDLIAYPKNGQTAEQQATDKYECHHWAVTQTGFDPTQGTSTAGATKRSDYMRAQAACLDARGYTVK